MNEVKGTIGKYSCYKVDPRTIIVVPGRNPRVEWGDLESLSASIEENGVLKPIELQRNKEGGLELNDGERRYRATMMAIERGVDIKSIPAFIKPANRSLAEALISSFISNDGKPFTPLEEAECFRRLVAWGWTQADTAKRIGKSIGYVNSRLKLLDASPELKEAIQDGTIKPTLATNIIVESQKPSNDVKATTFQNDAVNQVKAGKKKEITKAIKKPNVKLLKAMFNIINTTFGDAQETVKAYELLIMPRPIGSAKQEFKKDDILEAYELGRITYQAEMLGYSIDDIPELEKNI